MIVQHAQPGRGNISVGLLCGDHLADEASRPVLNAFETKDICGERHRAGASGLGARMDRFAIRDLNDLGTLDLIRACCWAMFASVRRPDPSDQRAQLPAAGCARILSENIIITE